MVYFGLAIRGGREGFKYIIFENSFKTVSNVNGDFGLFNININIPPDETTNPDKFQCHFTCPKIVEKNNKTQEDMENKRKMFCEFGKSPSIITATYFTNIICPILAALYLIIIGDIISLCRNTGPSHWFLFSKLPPSGTEILR